MLVCLSANPALDRRLWLERLVTGGVNRVTAVETHAGGKAAHVAMAARLCGEEVLWIGFLGGRAGAECALRLSDLGVPTAPVNISGETRTNLEIIDAQGVITELLEPGGPVEADEAERMLALCREVFSRPASSPPQVAVSGSLPPGLPVDFYAEVIRLAHAHNCRVLVDTSGEALRAALGAAPDLVKPNRDEIEALTGRPVRDARAVAEAARYLFEAGARGAAISLGPAGMFWQEAAGAAPLVAEPPRVEVRSTVGCGDAALAGFALAFRRGLSAAETVRYAAACGTANCLAEAPGMIDSREVERIAAAAQVHPLFG